MEWKTLFGKVVHFMGCVLPIVAAVMETDLVQDHQKNKKLEAKHKFLIIGFAYVVFEYLLYAWDAFVAHAKWSVLFFYKVENGKKIIFGEATHVISAAIVLAHLLTTILGLKTTETGLDVSDVPLVFSWTYCVVQFVKYLLEQEQLEYRGQQTLSAEGKLVNERRIEDLKKDPRTWEELLLAGNVGLGNHYLTPREKAVSDQLAGRGKEIGVEDDGLQKQVEGETLGKEESGVALEEFLRTGEESLQATNVRFGKRYLTPRLEGVSDQQARRWKEIEEVEDQGLQELSVMDEPLEEEKIGEDNIWAWEELEAKVAATRELYLALIEEENCVSD